MRSISRSVWNFVTLIIIGLLSSSFTLWLLEESWIKIPLFAIQTSIVVTIFLILNESKLNLRVINNLSNNLSNSVVLKWTIPKDILLVIFSCTLLILFIFEKESIFSYVQLFLAFICVSLLSGMVIVDLLRLRNYFSKLEYIVIAYLASLYLWRIHNLGSLTL